MKKRVIIATILFGFILSYSIFKIMTFTPSSLFGNLGAAKYYICSGVCLLLLYFVWLVYSIDYAEKNTSKKTRFIPLIIMIIIGVSVIFTYAFLK